jgi:pimeloyl-ACP methyl ester carboxylesterase
VNLFQFSIAPHLCPPIVVMLAVFCSIGLCAERTAWPPSIDSAVTTMQMSDGRIVDCRTTADGRKIERFTYRRRGTWGYKDSALHCLYVIHPSKPRKNAPLLVVLHSANRHAFDYVALQSTEQFDLSGIANIASNVPTDFYGVFLDSNDAEWWGWGLAQNDPSLHMAPTPTEKRVMDLINWTVDRYGVDSNRVYLVGMSMGGCGGLAIGLPHGDVFAAMCVWVPAATDFMAFRMGLAPAPASNSVEQLNSSSSKLRLKMPDPPVLVDLSAPNDGWSKDQGVLLSMMLENRFPLILGWGQSGHSIDPREIAKSPRARAAMEFPWMEIRKNEAYPVFTNASSDDRSPWSGASEQIDDTGQVNAYFRWKTLEDAPSKFSMQLWLDGPGDSSSAGIPAKSTSDIAIRRFQEFEVVPGNEYTWCLLVEGKTMGTGKAQIDTTGLLSISQITVTRTPFVLQLQRNSSTASPCRNRRLRKRRRN